MNSDSQRGSAPVRVTDSSEPHRGGEDLRGRFPSVGPDWARFDGPAGTQLVDTAAEASARFIRSGDFANDHGYFAASQACDAIQIAARKSVAELLGGQPEEIAFNSSSTANVFNLTRGLSRQWQPGDNVVCTELDHDANVAPWLMAAEDRGCSVRMATIDASSALDVEQFERLMDDRTQWVAVTAASNATGSTTDVEAIIEIAHAKGAKVLVDAVAYVPHRAVDVMSLGCDALVTSPYKWYGPHAGVLWLATELAESVPAYRVRASGPNDASRFEHGSMPYEQLAAIDAAAQFLLSVGYDTIRSAEEGVFSTLLAGLLTIDGVTVFGQQEMSDARTPTAAFSVRGHNPAAVAEHLASRHVAVWSGDFYALELTRAMSRETEGGFVRAGVSMYNTMDDVAALLDAVRSLSV